MAARVAPEYSEPAASFEPLAQHLGGQPNLAGEGITAKLLCQTTASLVAFCNRQLGRDGGSKGAVARLPARFFRSFGTDGPLAAILTVCFQYKVAQSWRRFDFKSAGKAEQFVDMLRKVEARLTEESLLVRPTCYISSSLPAADADAVAKILVAKGAAVVESPDDASHRIEPDPAGAAREDYAACCCAVQNLCLSLHADGLGTKWTTGAVNFDARFGAAAGLPDDEYVVGTLWFGRAATTPPPPAKRLGVEEVLRRHA